MTRQTHGPSLLSRDSALVTAPEGGWRPGGRCTRSQRTGYFVPPTLLLESPLVGVPGPVSPQVLYLVTPVSETLSGDSYTLVLSPLFGQRPRSFVFPPTTPVDDTHEGTPSLLWSSGIPTLGPVPSLGPYVYLGCTSRAGALWGLDLPVVPDPTLCRARVHPPHGSRWCPRHCPPGPSVVAGDPTRTGREGRGRGPLTGHTPGLPLGCRDTGSCALPFEVG